MHFYVSGFIINSRQNLEDCMTYNYYLHYFTIFNKMYDFQPFT